MQQQQNTYAEGHAEGIRFVNGLGDPASWNHLDIQGVARCARIHCPDASEAFKDGMVVGAILQAAALGWRDPAADAAVGVEHDERRVGGGLRHP